MPVRECEGARMLCRGGPSGALSQFEIADKGMGWAPCSKANRPDVSASLQFVSDVRRDQKPSAIRQESLGLALFAGGVPRVLLARHSATTQERPRFRRCRGMRNHRRSPRAPQGIASPEDVRPTDPMRSLWHLRIRAPRVRHERQDLIRSALLRPLLPLVESLRDGRPTRPLGAGQDRRI